MNVYNYDPVTKEFLSVEEADKSPLEPDVYLFPANSTTVAAPTELEEHKTPCFNTETKQWSIVDDYREVKLYSKETKEIVFAALGQTPEALNATILQPTSALSLLISKNSLSPNIMRCCKARRSLSLFRYKAAFSKSCNFAESFI
jgi:hypothetical protein